MNYIRKPTRVKAFYWDGEKGLYQDMVKELCLTSDDYATVFSEEPHWVVRDDGRLLILSEEEFDAIYEFDSDGGLSLEKFNGQFCFGIAQEYMDSGLRVRRGDWKDPDKFVFLEDDCYYMMDDRIACVWIPNQIDIRATDWEVA